MDIGLLLQNEQFGTGAFSIRYPCVSLEWPILILWRTTSSLLVKPNKWKGDISGMISFSFMGLHESLYSQRRCHLSRIKFLTRGMRSELGIRRAVFSSLALPSLAALSARTLPRIPTWLGTQQKRIDFLNLEINSWMSSSTSTTSGLSVRWRAILSKTDLESQKITCFFS